MGHNLTMLDTVPFEMSNGEGGSAITRRTNRTYSISKNLFFSKASRLSVVPYGYFCRITYSVST